MIERVGNYRIMEEIGSGGMAVVFKGVQESLGRTVAIKALRTSVAGEKDSVARFEREAQVLASFQHENIITVYDFFPKGGSLFIIMEFVEGIDLYDLLEKCPVLPGDVTGIVGLQVARALDYAHFRGLVHRDVKPANIILSRFGTVKLTDFGIARHETSDLTVAGVGLGTPAYMAPEQVLGKRLDHRCDMFSLGIVMYQMVTGKKPFEEDEQASTLEKVRTFDPPPPRSINPAVPPDLEAIILQCMEKEPADRFDSTQELVISLEQYLAAHVNLNYRARLLLFLQQQGVVGDAEVKATLHPALIGSFQGRHPRTPVRRGTRRALVAVSAVAVSLLLLVLVLAFLLGRSDPAAPRACEQTGGAAAAALPAREGRLLVVAHPWAEVEVDGKVLMTTPSAQPLVLPAGTHRVRLLNPYFEIEDRRVEVREGVTSSLVVALRRSAAQGAGR